MIKTDLPDFVWEEKMESLAHDDCNHIRCSFIVMSPIAMCNCDYVLILGLRDSVRFMRAFVMLSIYEHISMILVPFGNYRTIGK